MQLSHDEWVAMHNVISDARNEFAETHYPLGHRQDGRVEWMRTFAILAMDYLTMDEVREIARMASAVSESYDERV